jgi:RNA polymerase sigma-70 factor (ECF subfamily)
MRNPQTDEFLLTQLRAGDPQAVEDLAVAYGSRIYQLAFRHLKNKEDAEEVAQDVLYTIYRKVDAFRGDAAFSSWIYRITFNAAMSRLRSGRSERPQADEVELRLDEDRASPGRFDIPDWSDLADERIFRLQLRQKIARAILSLPAIYRAPVVLRDIQGMSTEEASAVLQVKDQTLKSRLHRGRIILRKQLAEFAGGLSLHHAFAS